MLSYTFYRINSFISMQNLFMVWLVFAGMCIVTTADSESMLATESNMKGHILKFNNTIILPLTCSSSMQIFDNMAEFLIDHKTSEVIKYYNGLCFDKNGVCLKTKCTCLKSGNSYSWIYKSRAIPKWQEFSCMINIRDDMNGIQYSVYTTLIYNGTELVMNGTERLIINGPIKETTETMHTRETSGHHVKFVGIGVPVAIIIMIGGICIYYRSHLQQTRRHFVVKKTKGINENQPLVHVVDISTVKSIEHQVSRIAESDHEDKNTVNIYTNYIKDGDEQIVDTITTRDDGDTALPIASRENNREIVRCLLNKFCNLNILNNKGEKPIDVVRGHPDIVKILKEYGNSLLPGLPVEVKKFDKESAHVFSSLLEEESYPHYESRLMIAGEQGTGKTTLARYLVGKQPTRLRISTDGIELYNGLSFMDRESKEWLGGHQDFSLEEITVSRSLLKEKKISKSVKLDDSTPSSQDVPVEAQTKSIPGSKRNLQRNPNDTLSSNIRENENTDSMNYRDRGEASINKAIDNSGGCPPKSGFTGEMHIETTVTKPGAIRKLKNFFGVDKKVKEIKVSITKEKFLEKSSKVGKKQLHNKKIAPIIIWDFCGQDVFYSTHQTFLTYRAIYMIVLDGCRKLDDPCPSEQYLPGKSEHKTARDYLLFWINTIVTYCKGSMQGFPKILVVLTHKDQVKAHDVEERRQEIFAEINEMFHQTPLMQHLVIEDKIFVDAKDKNDTEMEKIKEVIIRESERQPTWGELLPKCFIPLELEFASLIRRNIPVITLEHLKKVNALQPIRPLSEDELKVFLKFQHSIGKLLYFDELKLDDRIILSPTLLIDAFKSIVTDKRFCKGDRKREEIWDAMGMRGVVSKQAIQEVWKRKKYIQFYKDKDYLLNVMTHLDILVEPKRYDSNRTRIPADFYYVASMVRGNDDSGYLHSTGFTQRNIAIAFQSTSLMIPPALSFRFISYCLSVWAVKTYGEANADMLFHRSGVFTIDPSLDMYILCEDDKITVRLIHARTNALIMRDLASSINECLTSALEKISQLYIRTSSDQSQTNDESFVTSVCCSSPDKPCIIPFENLAHVGNIWRCSTHGIEHNIHMIKSWISGKDEDRCEPGCPVTNEEFLRELPSDRHLRRLSLMFSFNEVRELAIHLGLSVTDVDNTLHTSDPKIWNFEVIRQCRDSHAVTFKEIKDAIEATGRGNIHKLCKLVKGDFIGFDKEPEKWDVVPTEEHIDRLVPLVGNKSLPFLIELGMDFHTWERISHKQNERDLVRLNKDILEEWSSKFCRMHDLKPTLREIAQSFSNIGKNVKIVENALLELF